MFDRKQLLTKLVLAMCIVGFIAISSVFIAALKPNAKSSEMGDVQFWINDLAVNQEASYEFLGRPILIQRLGETDFRIFEMIAKNQAPSLGGCLIQRGSVPKGHPAFEEVVFIDPCRASYFDYNGNVLPGSLTGALPLNQIDWYQKNEYLYLKPNS